MCNHLTANGSSERLWHHAGLESCGLTSTANQQTARASQWMTAKSLGDEASCWGQRAVVLTLHQCTDKTEQHIHATHRLQRSLHPSLSLHISSNVTAAQAWHRCAEARQRAGGSCTGKLGEAGGRGRGWPYCMLNHVVLVCKGLSFTPNMLNTDPAKPIRVWLCALVHAHLQMNEGSHHTELRLGFLSKPYPWCWSWETNCAARNKKLLHTFWCTDSL